MSLRRDRTKNDDGPRRGGGGPGRICAITHKNEHGLLPRIAMNGGPRTGDAIKTKRFTWYARALYGVRRNARSGFARDHETNELIVIGQRLCVRTSSAKYNVVIPVTITLRCRRLPRVCSRREPTGVIKPCAVGIGSQQPTPGSAFDCRKGLPRSRIPRRPVGPFLSANSAECNVNQQLPPTLPTNAIFGN